MIETAESLRWLEMQLLAVFADAEHFPMPDREPSLEGVSDWYLWTVHQAYNRLHETRATLTVRRGVGDRGQPHWDTRLSGTLMTSAGTLLVHTMQLADIPRSELRLPYEALTRESKSTVAPTSSTAAPEPD